jgi:t-SNARE complex subunit (syntaxin)
VDERLDRIERMVEDLIRIVGNTNAMVAETNKRIDQLTNDVSDIKDSFKRMEGAAALVDKRLDWQSSKIGQLEEKVAVK